MSRQTNRGAEGRERLEAAIDALLSSEGWRAWVTARGRFRRYSLHNSYLIAAQAPDATYVAGSFGGCIPRVSFARARARIRQWTVRVASRGLAARRPGRRRAGTARAAGRWSVARRRLATGGCERASPARH